MTDESLGIQIARLMGEAMAMEEDFDLSTKETFPHGAEAYDRIATRRAEERRREDALVNRHTVIQGNFLSLLGKLEALSELDDPERAHREADKALLDYIGHPAIKSAFDAIHKYYA